MSQDLQSVQIISGKTCVLAQCIRSKDGYIMIYDTASDLV